MTGIVALILGAIGVFLPLLPTTPFVLLAAYCFSKSSEKLHQWLLNHKVFGALISDWENHGVIQTKVKVLTTVLVVAMVSYPLIFGDFYWYLKVIVVVTISLVLMFIWTRPGSYKQPMTDSKSGAVELVE